MNSLEIIVETLEEALIAEKDALSNCNRKHITFAVVLLPP